MVGLPPPKRTQWDPPSYDPPPGERPGRIEYLYLTPEEKVVVDAMNEAIDELPAQVRARCMTPEIKETDSGPVEYFQHMDYDERTPPDQEEADLMCRTAGIMCPLAEQCLKLGLGIKADHGVWGGRTLVDGKDYYMHNKEEKNG